MKEDGPRDVSSLRIKGDVSYTPDGFDRYGRTLGTVNADTVDVGEILLKEGHALPFLS